MRCVVGARAKKQKQQRHEKTGGATKIKPINKAQLKRELKTSTLSCPASSRFFRCFGPSLACWLPCLSIDRHHLYFVGLFVLPRICHCDEDEARMARSVTSPKTRATAVRAALKTKGAEGTPDALPRTYSWL